MRVLGIHKGRPAAILALAGCLGLSGCDLFSSAPEADVPKPQTLNPESDLFNTLPHRAFTLTEGIIRGGKDTVFTPRDLHIVLVGDTVIGGTSRRHVEWEFSPAPAGALALLGLNPARLFFDTTILPDPGPALRFPDTPRVGWTLDTTVGDLRFVRKYAGVQTIKAAGRYHECWAFSESTYLSDTEVSTGTYWLGASGLVLHRQEWKAYAPSGTLGGTFWRETLAAN
jgi:hypothetical protein